MDETSVEYNSEAPFYDKSRFEDEFGKYLDYMHKKIVRNFMNSSGKMVLDAGTGTGRFAIWLAKKGFTVIGVDISREMLKTAKNKAYLSNSYMNIDLVLADLRFLPFRKESFDNCICINVVNHLPVLGDFLKEIAGILKPSGYFIANFPNLLSPYLPIAIVANIRKRALFKREIFSKWFTLRQINHQMLSTGFNIKDVRGCMVASPIPLGNKLLKIVYIINLLFVNSKFKLFSGSLFIKAQPAM